MSGLLQKLANLRRSLDDCQRAFSFGWDWGEEGRGTFHRPGEVMIVFLVQKVRGSKAVGRWSSVSSLSGARPCPGAGGSVPGPFLSQEPWWGNAQPSSSLMVVVLFCPWESRSSPGRT